MVDIAGEIEFYFLFQKLKFGGQKVKLGFKKSNLDSKTQIVAGEELNELGFSYRECLGRVSGANQGCDSGRDTLRPNCTKPGDKNTIVDQLGRDTGLVFFVSACSGVFALKKKSFKVINGVDLI